MEGEACLLDGALDAGDGADGRALELGHFQGAVEHAPDEGGVLQDLGGCPRQFQLLHNLGGCLQSCDDTGGADTPTLDT